MKIEEINKFVSSLKLKLFKNANAFAVGMLKSHFKGTGLQFKEHQIYSHGDDVRFIDWKLLAKSNTPYIKTFEEERNVQIVVVIDASSSMYYGVDGKSKLEAALEVLSLLYLLTEQTNDKVQLLLFHETLIDIPPMSGEKAIHALLRELSKKGILQDGTIAFRTPPENSIEDKIKMAHILKHLKRQKEIVVLSDFHHFLDASYLDQIVKRAKLHCFQILAPIDRSKKSPFHLHLKGTEKKGGQATVYVKQTDQNFWDGRIKQLYLEERYLEEFVKEML